MTDAVARRFRDLESFLPPRCFEAVLPFFRKYPIALTITRERKTRLGDYCPPKKGGKAHQISVNGNLNPYAFLVTLLHEIAHLQVYEQHRQRVKPHGPEWKAAFGLLLTAFANAGLFPKNLEPVVRKSAASPASATFRDVALSTALRHYDPADTAIAMAAGLQPGDLFRDSDGQVYEVLERRRTRLRCRRQANGREYLVPFAAEVERIPPQKPQ